MAPLLARRKSSNAINASFSSVNSVLRGDQGGNERDKVWPNFRNESKRFQNSGSQTTDWYDERDAGDNDAVGMEEVSNVRLISCGLASGSRETIDGDGERMIDGVRVCLNPVVSFGRESEVDDGFMSGPNNKGFVSGSGEDLGKTVCVGSQLKPGLTIKFIVSPSFTLYSFNNLLSASAFPLSKRRCASAGGARG